MSQQPEKSKFSFGLTTKIISVTFTILIALLVLSSIIFLTGYRQDMQESYVKRASGFTAVADAAKNAASEKFIRGDINTDQMLNQWWGVFLFAKIE